MKKYRWTFSK